MFLNYSLGFNFLRIVFFICILGTFSQCHKNSSLPQSPEEALHSFVLADKDLRIELVAAEPLVQDPVAIAFDEGGRLWVVEMLGFMQDIDGTGEKDKIGRVSVLFDDDGDGQMDRSKIFLDSLTLPRAIAVVEGGALIAENIPLWYVRDTDGDVRADGKTLIDRTYGGLGMPEHAANGLWRGMDNWYYNAKSKYRYRKIDGEWVREETEFRGQWGICHDNAGRLFYNYNWSQLHADLVPPNSLRANKNHTSSSGIDHGLTLERKIYPIRSNTAVNRGYVPGTLDDRDRLLEFASACGPFVYRGDALPKEYLGDAFVCEPTANLIKQNRIIEEGFLLRAEGVYKNREFLASTDERFRPISLASGPDGALYVVDMYKGIIQHGPYMTPYLREVTLERKLDKPIHMGRIWRITSKKDTANRTPDLLIMEATTLVGLLESKNGWTRDMAQRLLVEKQDEVVVPHLKKHIIDGSPLGQLHSLWTLEGLHYKEIPIYLTALKAKDSKVASAALRILMKIAPERPEARKEIQRFIQGYYDRADPFLQLHMVLACAELPSEDAFPYLRKFLANYGQLPIARDVVMASLEDREYDLFQYLRAQKEWKTYDQGNEIFMEMLVTAITNKGALREIHQVLSLLASNEGTTRPWLKMAIANGILNYRRSDDTTPISVSEMPALFRNTNATATEMQPLLDDLSQLFTWPGKPKILTLENKKKQEIDPRIFAAGRQQYVNLCASCHGTQGEGMARFAPPLRQSGWVTGEEYKLAMILLHGMEGPVQVNGKGYDIPDILPSMPSFSTLQNEDIAAIATYIRNSWGHDEPPVSNGTVGQIRYRTQGKVTPWKATELDTLVFDTDL